MRSVAVTGLPETFATGISDNAKDSGKAPAGTRAITLRQPDLYYSRFLDIYGRPNRLTLPERNGKANLNEALAHARRRRVSGETCQARSAGCGGCWIRNNRMIRSWKNFISQPTRDSADPEKQRESKTDRLDVEIGKKPFAISSGQCCARANLPKTIRMRRHIDELQPASRSRAGAIL